MPIGSLDIAFMQGQEATSRIRERLSRFGHMQRIFDSEFIEDLVAKRQDLDNYLVWLLATDYPAADAFCSRLDSDLGEMDEEGSIECFSPKFRENYSQAVFLGHFMHLDLASSFKNENTEVKLEPTTSSSKICDFVICDGPEVYFEVKTLRDFELSRERRFSQALSSTLRNTPYLISISISFGGERQPSVGEVSRFVKRKLEEMDARSEGLESYVYDDSQGNIIEIGVHGKIDERGGIVAVSHRVKAGVNQESIRRKLRKAASQLPKESPGVIIANCETLDIHEFAFEQALYGDISLRFGVNHTAQTTFPIGPRRVPNGFFLSNKKISAVCWTEFRMSAQTFSRLVKVYHNPWSKSRLDRSFFSPLSPRQYDIVSKDHEGFEMGW